ARGDLGETPRGTATVRPTRPPRAQCVASSPAASHRQAARREGRGQAERRSTASRYLPLAGMLRWEATGVNRQEFYGEAPNDAASLHVRAGRRGPSTQVHSAGACHCQSRLLTLPGSDSTVPPGPLRPITLRPGEPSGRALIGRGIHTSRLKLYSYTAPLVVRPYSSAPWCVAAVTI